MSCTSTILNICAAEKYIYGRLTEPYFNVHVGGRQTALDFFENRQGKAALCGKTQEIGEIFIRGQMCLF